MGCFPICLLCLLPSLLLSRPDCDLDIDRGPPSLKCVSEETRSRERGDSRRSLERGPTGAYTVRCESGE